MVSDTAGAASGLDHGYRGHGAGSADFIAGKQTDADRDTSQVCAPGRPRTWLLLTGRLQTPGAQDSVQGYVPGRVGTGQQIGMTADFSPGERRPTCLQAADSLGSAWSLAARSLAMDEADHRPSCLS